MTTLFSCSLSNLLAHADIQSATAADVTITGLSLDSRLIQPGDLYLAVAGASTHGLRFINDAIARGASAVAYNPDTIDSVPELQQLVETASIPVVAVSALENLCSRLATRFYQSPDQSLQVIAVTGTDGKTSVCRFISDALHACGICCGYIGTLGWGIGKELQGSELTTPDAVSLRRILASFKSAGATVVAMEASSHGIVEGRLNGLDINIAVLTNLGRDHLDYHGDIAAYRAAKKQLFQWPSLNAVVVNQDDEFGRELLQEAQASPLSCIAYGRAGNGLPSAVHASAHSTTDATTDASVNTSVNTSANTKAAHSSPDTVLPLHTVLADQITTRSDGLQFNISEQLGQPGKPDSSASQLLLAAAINSRLMGRFNVDNLLACYASLRALHIAANEARHALNSVTPVAGRMELFSAPERAAVIIDFAHTPQALSVAIEAARAHCAGQLWVVFGCGGDRDPGKRAPMAKAAELADCIVVTDDNPRTEESARIIEDIITGFADMTRVEIIANRATAIRHAVACAVADDVVLIAGKGHENYQIIGTEKLDYSDRSEVLGLLQEAS